MSANERQRLAWAMCATADGVDIPHDDSFESRDWRMYAETQFGEQARAFISATDALAAIRTPPKHTRGADTLGPSSESTW